MKSLFSPKDVVQICGISYRQLQYWDKTDFIKPSAVHAGRYRNYTFSEVVLMKLAKVLRENKVSIQRLRHVIESIKSMLPRVGCPLADCSLLVDGEKVFIFDGDVLMDAQSSRQFLRFDVRNLREEIDRIGSLPPMSVPIGNSAVS
ncbi:MAG: MerR family transcriptional regulator [Candidatus Riflebacteria bacterium]|nr:MerR family transcriptional regulator [Candidatus Riflebacteria bacterium]